jgi:hypothetical protein
LPDFPEPGEGSPGLLNSYIHVFNGSSIFRNITTEVGEVSHLPYYFVLADVSGKEKQTVSE